MAREPTKRSYTETERIGIMLMAIRDGVKPTATALTVPESTIYEWFQHSGGIVQVRSFMESAERVSLLDAKRVLYETVAARAPALPDNELMTTFREIIRTEKPETVQATAQAIGALHVHIDGEEVVVPRD